MNTIKKLKEDLKSLDIKEGDTLLVRADLGAIGKLESKSREDYLNFLLEAVGESGTIVGLSFLPSNFIRKDKSNIFDGTNKSNTGAFANIMLKHPLSRRSKHPTNSYVAIGKNAEHILNGHDENSGAYEPIRKIMELNGKMLLIGCVNNSPGFTTTHLAEVDLGLHKKIIWPTLNTLYYRKNNKVRLFKRKDLGSCSSSFYKFYAYYIQEEILYQGYIGNAYSLVVDAAKAYTVDCMVLKSNPKITLCTNPYCMLCRARRWDNLIDVPIYFTRILVKKIFNKKW